MNEVKKFQWSKFSPNQSEQFVIRTDDYDDLLEYRTKIFGIIPKEKPFPDDEGPIATAPEQTQIGLGNCSKCGSPNARSKKGNVYCSKKCWL